MTAHEGTTNALVSDPAPLRVMVVDDSVVMRSVIERMLEDRSDIRVVRNVPTTTAAFDYLSTADVDVILLDHEMPGVKGLQALPKMLSAAKGAHVVMLSSHCQSGSETAVQALSLGASDAIAKPSAVEAGKPFADALADRLRRMAPFRRRNHHRPPIALRPVPQGFNATAIGIGASTGGIHALKDLLSGLAGKPGVPLFVTQHLPEAFIPYYTQQVVRMTDLPVILAEQGMTAMADHVYLAPGPRNLVCERDGDTVRIRLTEERDPFGRTQPSVNIMFASLAACYGAGAVAIVLTGIGRDGTDGARAIVEAGGMTIAQDIDSSTVWGMPGSMARAGLASAALPPASMFTFALSGRGAAQ